VNVGYISSEQSVSRVKGTALRCQITDPRVRLKNENDIDAIAQIILSGENQVIIIDSISKLSTKKVTGSKRTERHARNMLIGAAVRAKVIVIFICHMNKDKTIKGGTDLIHDIDVELYIEKTSKSARRFYAEKNRNGELGECTMFMGEQGYVLDTQVAAKTGISYENTILKRINKKMVMSLEDLITLSDDTGMDIKIAIETVGTLMEQSKIGESNELWVLCE
jgi:predicted ATP-dependent serine protease